MTRYASAFRTYAQGVTPDQTSDIVPSPGDIWSDYSQNPPVIKKCTAVNPFTWASIEGGGGSINFADEEVPSGLLNGSNVTYTLAHTPSPAASLILTLNGVIQHQGVSKDYTLSTATITMAAAPASTDVLLAWYRF